MSGGEAGYERIHEADHIAGGRLVRRGRSLDSLPTILLLLSLPVGERQLPEHP